jgi:hypothetical protein
MHDLNGLIWKNDYPNSSGRDARVAHFINAIQQTPADATALDLGHNQLERFAPEELAQIFAAIPDHIKLLCIRGNDFWWRPETIAAFKKIPETVTTLVAGSSLDIKNIPAIPAHFTSINMMMNTGSFAFQDSSEVFMAAFRGLSPNLVSLSLRNSGICRRAIPELLEILAVIPERVSFADFQEWIQTTNPLEPRYVRVCPKLKALNDYLLMLQEKGAATHLQLKLIRCMTLGFLDGEIKRDQYEQFALSMRDTSSDGFYHLSYMMLAIAAAVAITLVAISPPALIAAGALTNAGAIVAATGGIAGVSSLGFFAHGMSLDKPYRTVIRDVVEAASTPAAMVV